MSQVTLLQFPIHPVSDGQKSASKSFCSSLKEKIKALWNRICEFLCCIICRKKSKSQIFLSETTRETTFRRPLKPFIRPTQTSKVNKLSNEITRKILSFLTPEDVMSFEQTCSDARKDCKSNVLWKEIIHRYFPKAKVPTDSCSKQKFDELAKRTVYLQPIVGRLRDKNCKQLQYYHGITKLSEILKRASQKFNHPFDMKDLANVGYLWGELFGLYGATDKGIRISAIDPKTHIPDDVLVSEIDQYTGSRMSDVNEDEKAQGQLILSFNPTKRESDLG